VSRRARLLPDPISDVLREPLVELIEVFRDNETVMTDVPVVSDREGVGLVRLIFNRKIGEIDGLIFAYGGIALRGDISLEGF